VVEGDLAKSGSPNLDIQEGYRLSPYYALALEGGQRPLSNQADEAMQLRQASDPDRLLSECS
jgi:hypothetical protein